MHIIAILMTGVALISSLKIQPWMDHKKSRAVFVLSMPLRAGDKVILNGCLGMTNDTGYNVGVGIAIKENVSGKIISPVQTRNVTPDMHHDSNSIMTVFEAPADGDYKFALIIWAGSTAADGSSLTIENGRFGQLIAQIINKE